MDTKNNTLLTTPPATCTRLNMLHTVARNKLVYTRKEVQGAEKARKVCASRSGKVIISSLRSVMALYSIEACHGDNEFNLHALWGHPV